MPQAALVRRPGVEAPRLSAYGALPLGVGNGWRNRSSHRLSYLVLYCKDVGEIAVVALCPDVLAGLGFDQLRGDANAIGGTSHAAFQEIAHAEFAADLLHVNRAADLLHVNRAAVISKGG